MNRSGLPWRSRVSGILHVTAPSSSVLDFLLMVQCSCMDSSPHARIPVNRKRGENSSHLLFRKSLESSLDCKEIRPVDPKGNQS